MFCLTPEDLRKTLSSSRSSLSLDEGLYPYFDGPEADCFGFDTPTRGASLPALGRALALLQAEEESYFGGALLWFDLWGIGSPQLDRIGWSTVERMRLGYGETRSLEVAPAHRFRNDEPTQLQAFLLQAFIFQWDANLVYTDAVIDVGPGAYGPRKLMKTRSELRLRRPRSGEIASALEKSRPHRCLIRGVRVERIIGRCCLLQGQ